MTLQMCCCVVLNIHGVFLYKAGSTLGLSLHRCIVNKMQLELKKFKVAVVIHQNLSQSMSFFHGTEKGWDRIPPRSRPAIQSVF